MLLYTLTNLTAYGSGAAFPCLVAQQFGMGSALVTSQVLRLLPGILLAPFVATFLMKRGAKATASVALLALAIATTILPHITDYLLFQGFNLFIGIIGMGSMTSMVTLRKQFIPAGKNITFNARITSIERISQLAAPALIGLLLAWCPIAYGFYTLALLRLLAAVVLWTTKTRVEQPDHSIASPKNASYRSFFQLLHNSHLWAIFIPLLGYALLLGALPSFLFFSTTNTFKSPDTQFPLLLTAHGVGGVIGSIIAPKIIAWMRSKTSILTIYHSMRLAKYILLLALAWIPSFSGAVVVLVLAGIPVVIGSVCFFTIIQQNLSHQQEGLFHMLSLPIFNIFVALGAACGGLYTSSWLSLHTLWLLIIGSAVLSTLPFLCISNKKIA